MNKMKENRMSFTSDHLIDQIIDGRKTASVEWLEKQDEIDEWDSALKVGDVYTVCDSHRTPMCKIRIVAIELCCWNEIPERLWKGETNSNADEFRKDHIKYFNNPEDGFEFLAYYFELIEKIENPNQTLLDCVG